MDKLDKIITESINDFINEDMGIHREPLVEMSRINTVDTDTSKMSNQVRLLIFYIFGSTSMLLPKKKSVSR